MGIGGRGLVQFSARPLSIRAIAQAENLDLTPSASQRSEKSETNPQREIGMIETLVSFPPTAAADCLLFSLVPPLSSLAAHYTISGGQFWKNGATGCDLQFCPDNGSMSGSSRAPKLLYGAAFCVISILNGGDVLGQWIAPLLV